MTVSGKGDIRVFEKTMRIAVVSEHLRPPYDEGIKKSTYEILKVLEERYNTLAVVGGPRTLNAPLKRSGFFWVFRAAREIHRFQADVVLYIPATSVTFFSFVRSALLKRLAARARHAMISFQLKSYAIWQQKLLPFLKPNVLFVQTRQERDFFATLGIMTYVVPSGIDIEKFCPVDSAKKALLRESFAIPGTSPVALHVGHLREGRGLDVLLELQGHGFQVVVVASTSTPSDRSVADNLIRRGVTIINDFLDNIETIYQASDAYVFPVLDPHNAISYPLSVLEAMACNLPVITTPFGALRESLDDTPGLRFWTERESLRDAVADVLQGPVDTRSAVQDFSWARVVDSMTPLFEPSDSEKGDA